MSLLLRCNLMLCHITSDRSLSFMSAYMQHHSSSSSSIIIISFFPPPPPPPPSSSSHSSLLLLLCTDHLSDCSAGEKMAGLRIQPRVNRSVPLERRMDRLTNRSHMGVRIRPVPSDPGSGQGPGSGHGSGSGSVQEVDLGPV